MLTAAHRPPDADGLLSSITSACLRAGVPSPDLGRPFRLVMLGMHHPELAASLAATHPRSQVWAWDPRPEYVEELRRHLDETPLDNVVVHERRSLPSDVGGMVDIVALDGLLEISSDAERRDLLRAVGEWLRPGGVLSMTYRTLAGWTDIEQLMHLMRYVALRYRGPVEGRAAHVLHLVRQLRDSNASFITKRPRVMAWVDELLTTDPIAVDREYLRHDVRPLSHAQATALAASIGCSFVGPAHHDATAELAPSLADSVAAAPTVTLRETYSDLAMNRLHRTDVFRYGAL